MKTIFSILVAALCLTALATAQVETQESRRGLDKPDDFFIDALNFAQVDSFGVRSRVDLFVKIPYTLISFVKNVDGFDARYTVTAVFSDASGARVKEETWEQKLHKDDFDETIARDQFDVTQKSFVLAPGEIDLEVIFEDGESKKEFHRTKRVTIRKYDQNVFFMSDLMIVSRTGEAGGKRLITPNVSANLGSLKDEFYLFFEIYNPFIEQTAALHYVVKSAKNVEMMNRGERQPLKQGKNTFITKVPHGAFEIGSYTITASLHEQGDTGYARPLATASAAFLIEWLSSGSPIAITDLDLAIEQLRYFARQSDLNYIREAVDMAEKRRRFEEFWERQNPIPGALPNRKMVEYYNRVAYANKNFGHFVDGWKTDRGMVYIVNGAPNAVERHPFDVETKPYEIWEYFDINRRFVFVDETGFGDYRLLYPIWDERNRMR